MFHSLSAMLIVCLFVFLCIISVLADVHFPSSSICRHGPREIRMDGLLNFVIKLLHNLLLINALTLASSRQQIVFYVI
jgi:hypothetical protein